MLKYNYIRIYQNGLLISNKYAIYNESVYDKVLEIAEKLKLNEEKLDSIEIDHNKYLNKDIIIKSLSKYFTN